MITRTLPPRSIMASAIGCNPMDTGSIPVGGLKIDFYLISILHAPNYVKNDDTRREKWF
jgi:hypothetical protein